MCHSLCALNEVLGDTSSDVHNEDTWDINSNKNNRYIHKYRYPKELNPRLLHPMLIHPRSRYLWILLKYFVLANTRQIPLRTGNHVGTPLKSIKYRFQRSTDTACGIGKYHGYIPHRQR